MSHTPTPWQHRTAIGIVDGDNELIADTYKSPYALDAIIANAAHIVRCVNTHDQLVAALKDMHEVLSDLLEDPHAQMTTQRYAALQAIDKSKQALAAAEKGA